MERAHCSLPLPPSKGSPSQAFATQYAFAEGGIEMEYIKAFIVGGLLCIVGQILIDKTKLTPARILVSYVVIGVF